MVHGAVNESTGTLLSVKLQGELDEQFAPTASTVGLLLLIAKSEGVPALLEVPPPASSVQIFVPVHPYRFCPGAASDLKNRSPAAHTAGKTVPVFSGRVSTACEK